ncbi:hypothetical protein FE697_013065 [Mumia zhuanghuii]|uniref:DUF4286 family protein n=2 Tax=Mumia TaxID=1546255 RepID=A0ABW1QJR7_9ACTN|nr:MULTISPECIES: DUF4286 family protein [Mumia]KAA1423059.1 hypothetical protein FE697_013065 [Mumia zhuanghuii]
MTNAIMVVKTNPVGGREDEFNAWYSGQHVPEILRVPGFVGARRYVALDQPVDDGGDAGFRYVAIYEIEGPVPDALAALGAAGIEPSPAMDERTSVAVYTTFPPKP